MLHLILMLNTMKILMKKSLNLKLVIMLEHQNTKTFLLKDMLKIGQKFLSLVTLKIQFRGLVFIDLNGEPISGTSYEKELQKTSQEKFRIEKVITEKVINYKSNRKDMIIHLIVGLIKKTLNEILLNAFPLNKNESMLSQVV